MNTFSLASFYRALLAVATLTMTVSCLPGSMPFESGGPFGAATGDGIGQRSGGPGVVRSSSVGFFGGGGGGYYDRGYSSGYGYRSRSACNVCGYNPCRCSNRSRSNSHDGHDDHDNHRPGSMFSSSSSRSRSTASYEKNHDHSDHPHEHDTYKVSGGSGLRSGQTKPSGYHSTDWYKSRGYDTSKLNLKNEHNEKKGSSGSKSSSSKKKKR